MRFWEVLKRYEEDENLRCRPITIDEYNYSFNLVNFWFKDSFYELMLDRGWEIEEKPLEIYLVWNSEDDMSFHGEKIARQRLELLADQKYTIKKFVEVKDGK